MENFIRLFEGAKRNYKKTKDADALCASLENISKLYGEYFGIGDLLLGYGEELIDCDDDIGFEIIRIVEKHFKVVANQTLLCIRLAEWEFKNGDAEKGKAYLAENAKKDGVKVTASGLQYEVIKEGTGKKPAATDTVSVHYEGTLINGQVFDSSIRRGQPVEFPLNRVIPGWTEGVQLMSVGSKYRFVIPSNLAYGEHGAGGAIGPNETLIFEVELLDIK